MSLPSKEGLYDPQFERDACGIGMVANIRGERTHEIVQKGVDILLNLEHRGASGCDPLTGDGAGILTQIPDAFFRKECAPLGIQLPPAGAYGAGLVFLPRAPGERDRCRQIHDRMAKLRRQIKGFAPARAAKRANRDRSGVPSVAIAGYTNAGKSSLLNRLTQAGVLVQNQLFATLDPTVRRSRTPDGREFTLSDTVGFVRNLPHQLVEAFRSTLEEVGNSDVIVHVVDGAHPDPASQLATVRDVIGEVGARDLPEIVAFNKADLLDDDRRLLLRGLEPDAIFVSARTGEGVDELLAKIADTLPQWDVELDLLVPYDRGEVVALAHQKARVLGTEYVEEGTRLHLVATERVARTIEAALAADSQPA